MPLVFGVRRVVSQLQEDSARAVLLLLDGSKRTGRYSRSIALLTFIEAYEELRRVAPKGNLQIYLSVEGTAEEVGAVFEEENTQ